MKIDIEQFKKSTLLQFFKNQGKATPEMFDDAYVFYCTFSRHKNRDKKAKNFTHKFILSMDFYNSHIEDYK